MRQPKNFNFGFDPFDPTAYLLVAPARQVAKKAEFVQHGAPYRGTVTRTVDERGRGVAVQIAPGKWLRRDWIKRVDCDGRVLRNDDVYERGDVEYLQRAGLL